MNTKQQLWCLYCGPAAMVIFTLGFWLAAGFIPPLHPNDTAREIQQAYQDNTDGIRIGLLLTMLAAAMTGPWVAVITTQMRRVEGTHSPLAWTQLGLGMLGILIFIFPAAAMQAVAFRPDRDPELMQLANDMAWLPFVGVWMLAYFQGLSIAWVCFMDTAEKVFPRWLGYFNVWVVLLFLPGSLIYFFKDGPFSWSGIFCFWLPLTVFLTWFVVMFVVLRRSVLRQQPDEAAIPWPRIEVPA
jgi:hypothetical protein